MTREKKNSVDRFLELREGGEAVLRDLEITQLGLDHIQKKPLLNYPLFISLVYDSKRVYAFMPSNMDLREPTLGKDFGSSKILSFEHTSETKRVWREKLMSVNRSIPGATAWDETTIEGGILWGAIQSPESFAVLNPNKAEDDDARELFIPSVALPAPLIIEDLVSDCPQIEGYFICNLTHEAEAHLADMCDLPWSWDKETNQFYPGRLVGNQQQFELSVETLTGTPPELWPAILSEIHNFHRHNAEHPLFQRDYLGELLAYAAEILRAKEVSIAVPNFSFEEYLVCTSWGVEVLDKARDLSRFPKIYKNKYGFEMAKFLVEKLDFDRRAVIKAMFETRQLMVGGERARAMFLEADLNAINSGCVLTGWR